MQCLRKLCSVVHNLNTLNFSVNLHNKLSSSRVFLTHKLRIATLNVLSNYFNQNDLPWNTIIENIKSEVKSSDSSERLPLESIHSAILNSCIATQEVDKGVSFFRYLKKKGEEISLPQYFILLKLLTFQTKDFMKHVDLVDELYQKFKPCLETSHLIFFNASLLFSRYPHLKEDIFQSKLYNAKNFSSKVPMHLFDQNDEKNAWEALELKPFSFNSNILEKYMNFCLKKAEKNEFSFQLLNNLVEFCGKHSFVVPQMDFYYKLKVLCDVLNKQPKKKFNWFVYKTVIDNKNNCKICKQKLKPVNISNEDVEELKSVLHDQCFVNVKNYLVSQEGEIKTFLKFLDKHSYRYILDGLNIYHKLTSRNKWGAINEILQNLGEKNKTVIVAKHAVIHIPEFRDVLKNYRTYLSHTASNDDLFIIYGCLHGGPETFCVSGDYYREHGKYFNLFSQKRLFLKWLLSHICILSVDTIHPPKIHAMLPQITSTGPKGFCWHISVHTSFEPKIDGSIKWICLKACPV